MNLYDVVTFTDDQKYAIGDILEKDGIKYYMLIGVSSNEEDVNEDDVRFMTDSVEDGKLFLNDITDVDTLREIIVMFQQRKDARKNEINN